MLMWISGLQKVLLGRLLGPKFGDLGVQFGDLGAQIEVPEGPLGTFWRSKSQLLAAFSWPLGTSGAHLAASWSNPGGHLGPRSRPETPQSRPRVPNMVAYHYPD